VLFRSGMYRASQTSHSPATVAIFGDPDS